MAPYFTDRWANAHSVHSPGQQARAAVERAREQVAALIGAEDPAQIAFTSGATESNNWVIRSHHGAISPFEHASVRQPALHEGYAVLDNEGWSVTPPASMVPFLSVMAANNETGAVLDLGPLRARSQVLHSDITQAVGKLFVDVGRLDLASFSAHKFGGPKGAGILYMRRGTPFLSLISGGGQERQRRAGTENVASIVGTAVAFTEAQANRESYTRTCRALTTKLVEGALQSIPKAQLTGHPEMRLPNNAHLSFEGAESDVMLAALDKAGIAASAGSACNSATWEPTHVMNAIGMPLRRAFGVLRFTVGPENTDAEIERLLSILPDIVAESRASPRRVNL